MSTPSSTVTSTPRWSFKNLEHSQCHFTFLSGIWKFVFLLPLAAHLVQERVQLPGHLHSMGSSLDKDVSFIECADKDMCRLARLSGQRWQILLLFQLCFSLTMRYPLSNCSLITITNMWRRDNHNYQYVYCVGRVKTSISSSVLLFSTLRSQQ